MLRLKSKRLSRILCKNKPNNRKYSTKKIPSYTERDLAMLHEIEKRLLWLSTYTIHHANSLREKKEGDVKVGGHQASSASVSTLIAALYFKTLQHEDRVAVKPHAQPIFQSAQYLHGTQTLEKLQKFRAKGGLQSYPSVTKDGDLVDISTGSVGLGASMTTFASFVQDYLIQKSLIPKNLPKDAQRPARMYAIVGDAELDEGNIMESLLESWKHNIRGNIWFVDYNRQSLDKVVETGLFQKIGRMFRSAGWRVVVLKYGKKQVETFKLPGGKSLKRWINETDNETYNLLSYKGGLALRERILADIGTEPHVAELLERFNDEELHDIMTNLGGHCLETLLDFFDDIDDNVCTCVLAYTIKGYGLPLKGHRDNHSGLLSEAQIEELRKMMDIPKGEEWNPLPTTNTVLASEMKKYIAEAPYRGGHNGSEIGSSRRLHDEVLTVPEKLKYKKAPVISTQETFGRIMTEIGRIKPGQEGEEFASRIVTTAPDVTSSTNLSGFVNLRGVFGFDGKPDALKQNKLPSLNKWDVSPKGQHMELGIAESNLFLAMGAFGLSNSLFGRRLLPVGTLYDPFIARGLDSLNYACYMDSRFLLVGTPSGVSLAPEGGAHQSIYTPLIGMGQPGLTYFEPAFADELAVIMKWAFEHMQKPASQGGGSVYLRLSTRPVKQVERELNKSMETQILKGAYWFKPPSKDTKCVLVYTGTIFGEIEKVIEKDSSVAVLSVTSPDILYRDYINNQQAPHLGKMLATVQDIPLVTVLDGHSATLAWVGSVYGCRVKSLGVHEFGASMNVQDIWSYCKIDVESITNAISSMTGRK